MSIFWMRKRRLLISILIGILIGFLATFALLYFFREDIHSKLYPKSQVNKYEFIVLNKTLKKGEIIKSENLKRVNSNKKINDSLSENELIGKELSINMHENIPLTRSIISKLHSYNDNDRLYEFSFIKLPNRLEVGDFVDIRIRFKTGEDYLIAGKKEIFSLSNSKDNSIKYVEFALNEEELLSVSSSYVDSILEPLCEVYLDKYIDPESQLAHQSNYPVKKEIARLFENNPNILNSSNIEEKINNRIILDDNMKKIIYENNKLVDYNLNKNDTSNTEKMKKENIKTKEFLKDESN